MTHHVRVELPAHLRTLAGVSLEVQVDVTGDVTTHTVLSAIEAKYPMLAGTMRDHATHKRRAFVAEQPGQARGDEHEGLLGHEAAHLLVGLAIAGVAGHEDAGGGVDLDIAAAGQQEGAGEDEQDGVEGEESGEAAEHGLLEA